MPEKSIPIVSEKKKKTFLFRVTRNLLISVIAIIGLIAFCNIAAESSFSKYIYRNVDNIPYNEFGVLLGTSKTINGVENFYFTERMNAAALLYHKGKIKYILASGALRTNPYYDGPSDMTHALIARRVPPDRIIKDNCGYRTFDSMHRACDVFGLKKFTVISQYSHITRAVYIARSRGLDVIGFAADSGEVPYLTLRDRLREYLAKVKMVLDIYILNTKPKVPFQRAAMPATSEK